NRHLRNGCVLGQQAAEGAGNSYGPRRPAQGSVTGCAGTGLQVAGIWLGGRIALGNPREPGAGFHRVSGNSTRSAGIGWSCSGYGLAWPAGNVDPRATRALG